MSVKMMGLVWDSFLPRDEKFILLAYADHANHDGKDIFPSVPTMARKTGYSERSVQIITKKLVHVRKVLIPDGKGPRGTKKWKMHQKNLREFRPEESSPRRKQQKQPEESSPEPNTEPSLNTSSKEKKPTTYQKNLLELENAFVEYSGIPSGRGRLTNRTMQKRWWTPLYDMFKMCNKDMGQTKAIMQKAIRRLREEKLTFDAPASIEKTFTSLFGEQKGKDDNRGYTPT
jgi:hypothetical protein